jgi:hypothetical protein
MSYRYAHLIYPRSDTSGENCETPHDIVCQMWIVDLFKPYALFPACSREQGSRTDADFTKVGERIVKDLQSKWPITR